jgi:hypothetical protein
MTAGNDGASTPEDDDPFGYLYADGQASGATPPSGGGGYGYPGPRSGSRSSYHQVRTVGERQYGQPAPGAGRGGYGYPPAQGRPGGPGQPAPGQGQTAAFPQPPSPGYDQPSAHYQAPETLPGGPQGHRHGPPPGYGAAGGGGGRGRGPNTKGLLIGALAVVAAVVLGIGMAVLNGPDDSKDDTKDGATPQATATDKPSHTPSHQAANPAELPKSDASALKLEGGSYTASDIKGAQASGGRYVAGLNQPGASATWTVDNIPKAGKYTLDLGYGVPGKDATMTLTVNGTPQTTPLSLKNWAGAKEGDWEKGWTQSYAYVELEKGSNTLRISCEQGNQCDVNLDQVWLEKGWKKS